ncbi:mechanosensory protein 2-like, partial [Tropilaelaps mercedesae]
MRPAAGARIAAVGDDDVVARPKSTVHNHQMTFSGWFCDSRKPSNSTGYCTKILTVFSILVIGATFPFSLCLCIKIVQEYERAVIFRLGRLLQGGAKGPGIALTFWKSVSHALHDITCVGTPASHNQMMMVHLQAITLGALFAWKNSPLFGRRHPSASCTPTPPAAAHRSGNPIIFPSENSFPERTLAYRVKLKRGPRTPGSHDVRPVSENDQPTSSNPVVRRSFFGCLSLDYLAAAGLFFIIPCIDTYSKVDLRTVSFDVPPQEILSKDSVTVAVDAVVYYRISNATIAITNVEDYGHSTRLLAATTLRNVLGTKNLSEILSERESISHVMQ